MPPPRYPRALFVAAFAVAGAASVRLKPGRFSADTVARIQKRDASLIGIVSRFGRAFLAASRAQDRFDDTHDMIEQPRVPDREPIHPLVNAVLCSRSVAALIGVPAHERNDDADAWVELRLGGARPYLNLFWRGDAINADATVTGWSNSETETGRVVRVEHRMAGDRALDPSRMREAANAACTALREAGFTPSSFVEVRRIKTGSLGGGGSFEGLVATIGIVAAPKREPALVR